MKHKLPAIIVAIIICLTTAYPVAAANLDDVPFYSYTYDFENGRTLPAPHAYLPDKTIYLKDGMNKPIIAPEDMFITKEGHIIVADTGNSRIIEFRSDGSFVRELTEFYNIQIFGNDKLNTPMGVFVNNDGELFVADTGNKRVLWFRADWQLRKAYIYPATELLDNSIDYLPIKVANDSQGRIFIIAQNVNQGIIEIDQSGNFVGFLGAAKAKVNANDLFWRLLSTKKQKERMTLFVPSEYNNMFMDDEDFIYCTTSAVSESDLRAAAMSRSTDDRYAPIRRINPSGSDVLRRTGAYPPLGDLWSKSVFTDVTVRDSGIYTVLDSGRGRIFTYDINGNLLYVFGQTGERNGTMKEPVAIGHIDDTLYVLDKKGALYSFKTTEYGDTIHAAARAQNAGDYEKSFELWNKTLEYNHNYELAFIEIGKTQLRLGDYKGAMESFRDGSNRNWYSEAKRLYVNKETNKNFNVIAISTLVVILMTLLVLFRKRIFTLIPFLKNRKVKVKTEKSAIAKMVDSFGFAFYTNIHPFKGFWECKYEKRGNFWTATVIIAILVFSSIVKRQLTEYVFNYNTPESLNVPMEFAAIVIPLLLWCTANWTVTTLFDGKGKFRDIYIYTSYALIPLAIANFATTLFSQSATLGDLALYNLITSIATMWAVGLILVGTMTVHEYTMSKTLLSCASIVVAMALMMFVALVFMKVIEQMYGFVYVLFKEIVLRM